MASVARSGRANVWPRSCAWSLAWCTTPPMWAGYSKPSAGDLRNRCAALGSATRRPLRTGAPRRGPRSNGGGGAAADDPLRRRIRVFSPAQRGAHRCARGPDTCPAGVVHPRSSLGHLGHLARGQGVLPQPGLRHHVRRCGRLSRAPAARSARPDGAHLGRRADPSPSGHPRLPRPWRRPAPAPGAPPGLCSGAQPGRGALATPQRRRAAPCLRLRHPPSAARMT